MSTIGIIGCGIVGKSLVSFLSSFKDHPEKLNRGKLYGVVGHEPFSVHIWDKRELKDDEKAFIDQHGAAAVSGQQLALDAFIEQCDVLFVSPGVAVERYRHGRKLMLCELDLFSLFFTKPTIAVTGSLGKTTTTKLLGVLTQGVAYLPEQPIIMDKLESVRFAGKQIMQTEVGGNIGIGMLDLIKKNNTCDLAVLELSSFQLDLNTSYAPDVAVWTNFYPNHLDRHMTEEAYFEAKYNLIAYQHEGQLAVLGDQLLEANTGKMFAGRLPSLKSTVCFTSAEDLDIEKIRRIDHQQFYWAFVHHGDVCIAHIIDRKIVHQIKVFNTQVLPDCTFINNWIQVVAVLFFLGADMQSLELVMKSGEPLLDDHHHRVEYFATIDGVDFYEDSKSTVIQATQAAVARLALQKRPLIVIVGGLSKGVDRRPLMEFLESVPEVTKIYCFGSECDMFAGARCFETLNDVVADIKQTMKPGDIVLFSPSGASFDFFENYKHRGQVFKELVLS